jgi:DNA-binding response OmpR family regulator
MPLSVVPCPTCGHPVNWSDELVVDITGNKATVDGRVIKMRPAMTDILFILSQRMPRTVSAADLVYAYAPLKDISEKSISVYIHMLRRKLQGTSFMIENEWGRGWRLAKRSA